MLKKAITIFALISFQPLFSGHEFETFEEAIDTLLPEADITKTIALGATIYNADMPEDYHIEATAFSDPSFSQTAFLVTARHKDIVFKIDDIYFSKLKQLYENNNSDDKNS